MSTRPHRRRPRRARASWPRPGALAVDMESAADRAGAPRAACRSPSSGSSSTPRTAPLCRPGHRDRRRRARCARCAGSARRCGAGPTSPARARCCWPRRGRSAPASSGRSTSSSWRCSATRARSTCAARSCTTRTSCADLRAAGRGVRRRARRGARRHDGRVLRARRRAGGPGGGRAARARPSSTPPARWWPRCTPRRAASPAAATRCCSSATTGTTRPRARSARRRAGSRSSQNAADAERVAADDPERVVVPDADHARRRRGRRTPSTSLRRRFPAIESSATDDICYATTNRQQAVRAIAAESDVVLVLGSANSSNSLRLVEVAERAGTPAHLVDDATEHPARVAGRRADGRHHRRRVRAAAPRRRGHRHPAGARPGRCHRAGRHHERRPVHPPEGGCRLMPVPMRQGAAHRLRTCSSRSCTRREKFPLIVELEPLFACNLKCNGCGKIQQPHDLLRQRMPVEQAVAAIEECGAPMVSIAGGEPLMHPQIDVMVNELVKRKKYVYLCTNAELVRKRCDKFDFKPSPYFSLRHPHRRPARAARRVGRQGRRVRRGRRGDQVPARTRASGSPRTRRSSTPTPRRRSSTC